jgi:hypothetical protein
MDLSGPGINVKLKENKDHAILFFVIFINTGDSHRQIPLPEKGGGGPSTFGRGGEERDTF